MKKFSYSLEAVYQFKQKFLDKLKKEYAVKLQDVQMQQRLLEDLRKELHHYEEEFEKVKKEGCAIEKMMIYVAGIERMRINFPASLFLLRK